jgi:broad specificity phosphatase PhoE
LNLILARHGNTFESNETPYWVGSKNNLPLTAKGKEQAEKLAEYLISNKLIPDAVYCGPLKRTKEYAQIVSKITGLKTGPIIDDRLNELDYGDWSGLDTKKTVELFGEDLVKAWEDFVAWPSKDKGNWGGSKVETIKNLESFLNDIKTAHKSAQNIVAVTSNGVLKHFWLILDGEQRIVSQNGKVKTGAFCQVLVDKGFSRALNWNTTP